VQHRKSKLDSTGRIITFETKVRARQTGGGYSAAPTGGLAGLNWVRFGSVCSFEVDLGLKMGSFAFENGFVLGSFGFVFDPAFFEK